jgi:Flp pilus assembly protein TadD
MIVIRTRQHSFSKYQTEKETTMRTQVTPKTIRRLVAADGYMELGMPQRAVVELNKITNAGPLEGPRHLLLGLAQKRSGHPEAAIPHLENAARLMPAPVRRFAWSELAACYRHVGSDEMADLAETLGGPKGFELRIALPNTELTITSTETTAEAT